MATDAVTAVLDKVNKLFNTTGGSSATQSRLSALYDFTSGAKLYSYPSEIGNPVSEGHLYPHYVMFNINVPVFNGSQVSANAQQNALTTPGSSIAGQSPGNPTVSATTTLTADTNANTTRVSAYISLYMPDTVSMGYDAQYEDISLKDKKLTGLTQGASTLYNAALKGSTKGGLTIGDLILAGMQDNSFFPARAILQSNGVAINPNVQLLFRAVGLRQFQFEFMFSPKSSDESKIVKNIIQLFKFHAAPEILGSFESSPGITDNSTNAAKGLAFIIPSTFDISFKSLIGGTWSDNPSVANIGTSVLESINVDYAPNGWSTFTDGSPTQIRLTLQFKETFIITKSEVNIGY